MRRLKIKTMLSRKLAQDRRSASKLKTNQTSLGASYVEPPWKQNATLYNIPLGSLMSCLDAWSSINKDVQRGLNEMMMSGTSVSDALSDCDYNDVSFAVSTLTGFNDSLDCLLDDVIDGLKLR